MSRTVEEMIVDKWIKSGLLVGIDNDDLIKISLYLEEATIYYGVEINEIYQHKKIMLILPIIRRLFAKSKELNVQEIIKNSEAYFSSDFYKDNVKDILDLDGDGEAEMIAYFTEHYNELDHVNKNYFI